MTPEDSFLRPVERLAAEVADLKAQLELASEREFYLKADIAVANARIAEQEKAHRECERQYQEGADEVIYYMDARDELLAFVAELKRDKARLDWLLSQGVCWRDCDKEIPGECWRVGPETEWLYCSATFNGRQRIDAAMQEGQP
jgi:hypothetical protein